MTTNVIAFGILAVNALVQQNEVFWNIFDMTYNRY